MKRRWAVVVALGLAGGVVHSTRARAGPDSGDRAGFDWEAPGGCPSATEARRRLDERLAADVPAPTVRAIVRREGEVFTASIEIRAGEIGTLRELGSPSCETLLDVTTLLAATIAEESAEESAADARDPLAPTPAPEGPVVPPPAISTPESVVESPAPTSRGAASVPSPVHEEAPRSLEVHADARSMAGLGVAPDVDFGGGAAIGLHLRHLAVEIAGSGSAPRRARIPGAEAHLVISSWSLEARGCGRIALGRGGRVHALPCAALLGGGYHSRSDGPALVRSGRERDMWLAAAAGPMATVRLGRRVGLVVGVEGLAFLRRPAVAIEPLGEVLRVRPLGVRATLGLQVRFSVTDRARPGDVGP